jgi:hypothetical protein
MLKVAELRAQGKTPEEVKRFVSDAFVKSVFRPPPRPGVDYMLSTENVVSLDPEKGTVGHRPRTVIKPASPLATRNGKSPGGLSV